MMTSEEFDRAYEMRDYLNDQINILVRYELKESDLSQEQKDFVCSVLNESYRFKSK